MTSRNSEDCFLDCSATVIVAIAMQMCACNKCTAFSILTTKSYSAPMPVGGKLLLKGGEALPLEKKIKKKKKKELDPDALEEGQDKDVKGASAHGDLSMHADS